MRVIVATDLSEPSLLAVEALASCESGLFSEVVLLHVVDVDLYTAGGSVPGIIQWAEGELAKRVEELRALGFRAHARVEQGPVAETVGRIAADEGAALVMVADAGEGLSERKLGRMAERLALESPVPVLVERVGQRDGQWCRLDDAQPFRRVLVADDVSGELARLCAAVCRLPGVDEMRIVHVAGSEEETTAAKESLEAERGDLQCAAEPGITVRVGEPVSQIAEAAREFEASVIVMAPHRRGPVRRLVFGQVTAGVVGEVDTRVLLVPPPGD